MKLFNAQKEKTHTAPLLAPLFLCAALALLTLAAGGIYESNRTQEKEFLSRALDRSVTQCYALEGAYPPDLGYLKEHYGLTYNETHFFVDYQYIGANLRPDITIIERDVSRHD